LRGRACGTMAVPGSRLTVAPRTPSGGMFGKLPCVGELFGGGPVLVLRARRTLPSNFFMPGPDIADGPLRFSAPRSAEDGPGEFAGVPGAIISTVACPGGKRFPLTKLPA
jgi:hypothetical protein